LLRLAFAFAIALFAFLPGAPASAASACADAVLKDWSEDGQVAPRYSLPCYEEAIDALPPDLRDYTDAEDVITRALSSAVRTDKAQTLTERSSDTVVPVPVIAIVAGSLAVLAAGALGHLSRRRYVRQAGHQGRRR
jgi:hypothetical protein